MPKKIKVPEKITRLGIWPGRHPAAVFLVALMISFGFVPFEGGSGHLDIYEAIRFAIVLLFAVITIGGSRWRLMIGIVIVLLAFVAIGIRHVDPTLMPEWVVPVMGAVFIAFVTAHLVRFVVFARRVDSEVLCAAVAGYLMLGMLWAAGYAAVSFAWPGSFSGTITDGGALRGLPALYFSFITLTTCGYGDITPLTAPARLLTMFEAITGIFYMAILMARLVALYSPGGAVESGTLPKQDEHVEL